MLHIVLMHISHFVFLLMTYYLLFIFDYRNEVRQKANSSNFFIWVQMGHKPVETAHNNSFGSGAADKTYNGCSRSFAKETRTLKTRMVLASHWKLTVTNWETLSKLILLKHMISCSRTQQWPFYSHSAFEIGTVKKLNKWVRHELTENQKTIIILKCCLLLFCATTVNHFSTGLWHTTKRILYATSDDQLSGWTEKQLQSTSQSQTCTPKKS